VEADRQIGRFTLNDLMEERYGCQVWRGQDTALQREVVLWLVDADSDLVADLEASTRIAATVDDRRILKILDLFEYRGRLVLVTEVAEGEPLSDHLTEPLPPAEAARIGYEVAGAIESAHAAGIVHGRLRPSNVSIGPDGEVRVSGLGIDAVLAGVEPAAQGDPVAADLHGIGSVLYAGLTARWPGESVEGIPASPEVSGHTPPPSRLIAEIPESLDDICARCVRTIPTPRGRAEFTSAGQVREHLGASLTDLTLQRRPLAGRPATSPVVGRVLIAAGIVLLVLGLLWTGMRLLRDTTSGAAATPAPTPSASASKPRATEPKAVAYKIVAGRDYDPLGNGEESPARVPFAYDRDRTTAWRTVTYFDKGLDNKPGVGIVFDLGAPRAIGKVTLSLVGNGTDLQILTSNRIGAVPQDFDLMAQATEAGERVSLKAPTPPSARYVLVWMTGLPQVDGGYKGGIREVTITS
jgi:putative peptidoglycan lipid II flippase